jgi:3-dehydrosphinganine reductase
MKGVIPRPPRVRTNKVVKPSASASPRGGRFLGGRHQDLAALVAAHEQQHLHHHHHDHEGTGALGDDPSSDLGHSQVAYDPTVASEQYAAAAAAAVAAADALGGIEDSVAGHDPDHDADMDDDDDGVAGAMGQHTEHLDLNAAANILANGTAAGPGTDTTGMPHAHSHVHHHQPTATMGAPQQTMASHSMDPQLMKTTEDYALTSGYGSLNIESALAKRLSKEPGLRLADQRRPEQQLNLARRSNVEALFAHIAGALAPQPCKNCHKGHGPWNSCVIVDGQMCGSCANCWFNASGARCSFHGMNTPP